jgi:hypothetical protein
MLTDVPHVPIPPLTVDDSCTPSCTQTLMVVPGSQEIGVVQEEVVLPQAHSAGGVQLDVATS